MAEIKTAVMSVPSDPSKAIEPTIKILQDVDHGSSEEEENQPLGSDSEISADEVTFEQVLRERDTAKAAFLDHIKNSKNEEQQHDASAETLRVDDNDAEPSRIIDKVRDYQQELFERAKDENVIAV